MSHNLLNVPLRRTSQSPIRQALRTYINQKHPETHPEAFEWDISEWESQRKETVQMDVHEDTIPHLLRQVVHIACYSTQHQLTFPYRVAIMPSSSFFSRSSLQMYDISCFLF